MSEPAETMDEPSEDVFPIGADEATSVSRPTFKVADMSEDALAEASECKSLTDVAEAKSHELSSVLLSASKTTEREGNCYW